MTTVQIEHDLESLHAKVCELRTEHMFLAQKCIKYKKDKQIVSKIQISKQNQNAKAIQFTFHE